MWMVLKHLSQSLHSDRWNRILFLIFVMSLGACTSGTRDTGRRGLGGGDTYNAGDGTSDNGGSDDSDDSDDTDGVDDDQLTKKSCNDFAGIDIHASVRENLYNSVAEAGLGWVRVDFNWTDIQPKSASDFDWNTADKVVDYAKKNNLKIFATLAYTPPWARSEGCGEKACPPASKESWRQFVSAVVDRYKSDIHHWGMWNEPNLPSFWQGGRESYVNKILKPGSEEVKKIDSTALVIAPDLAYGGKYEWEEWTQYISKQAKGSFDIFAIHVYDDNDEGTGEDLLAILRDSVKPVLKKQGILDNYPVWLSEFGWRTSYVSQQAQSDFLLTILKTVQKPNWAWLEKVFIYNLTDGSEDRDTWGILLGKANDFAKKQAFTDIKKEMKKVNDKCSD